MKYKSVKRVLTLALGFALSFALFAPMTVLADGDVVWQMATDGDFQALPVGTTGNNEEVFGELAFLNGAGGTVYTLVENPHGSGHAIQLTERRQNHYALDLHVATDVWGITNNQYTLRVRANAENDAGFALQGADSPWGVIATANFTGDFMEVVHTFRPRDLAASGASTRGIRIQTNAPHELTIYEIVLVRGTSIPDELPTGMIYFGAEAEEVEEYEVEEYEAEEYEEEYEEEEEEVYVPFVPITVEIEEPTGVTIRLTVDSTTAVVNGVSQTLLAAPFIDAAAGRTMVPFRFIGEAMGAEVEFDADTRTASYALGGQTLELVLGEELPGGMGTPELIAGTTLVPVRFVTEFFGAELNVALPNITIQLGDAPAGNNSEGIIVGQAEFVSDPMWGDSWDGTTSVVVVIGEGEDTWPHAAAASEGERAFAPTAGNTYRISFNVTNHGTNGWRVRWTRTTASFGENTAGDYAVVNDHPFAPTAVANVIPAHFNQGVSPDGTYTLVVDVTLDGSQSFDELIGNIALTGTGGSHQYVINWVTVEHGGNVLAQWSAE